MADRPVATLGSSVRSERELRPVLARWTLGTAQERQTLDQVLRKFVERYRGTDSARSDDLVPLAQVFRGFNALQRAELASARKLAKPALAGPAGATHDLGQLLMGAIDRRAGQHRLALQLLAPLQHKMLDAFATNLLNEELVAAALGARRYAAALGFMEVWRREGGAGYQAQIDARIAALLATLPRDALWAELERRRQRGVIEQGIAMATAIARRLAQHAVESKDAALAKLLLTNYAALLGPSAVEVARLAAARNRGRVAARTVGLLLSLQTRWQRRRSADVAAGMAFGLGLPGSGALLVSATVADEPRATDAALERLAAQGASVVVGGVDRAAAGALAEAAQRAALPVLLLTPPPRTATPFYSPFVFLLGAPAADATAPLLRSLAAAGRTHTGAIGDDVPPADTSVFDTFYHCDNLPDVATLRGAGLDSLLLLDGSFCFRNSQKLAQSAGLPLASGLGVAPVPLLPDGPPHLAAGVFPLDPAHPDPRLRGWRKGGHMPPSWWTALGRDGAVLAWQAVKDLTTPSSDREQVASARLQVTSRLAAARHRLWTSQTRGFNSQQRISRPATGAPP